MEHGKRSSYVRGCRCEECTAANREYEGRRSRQKVYGTWDPDKVDAEYARAHVTTLRNQGMGLRRISEQSGVSRSALMGLFESPRSGKPKAFIRRATHERIMAVTLHRPNGSRVRGVGTTRRLQALVRNGWTQTELAKRIGWDLSNFSQLMKGRPVRRDTAVKVAAVFEALKYRRGPSDRSRRRGEAFGWPFPDEWDGINIDDPKARPRGAR